MEFSSCKKGVVWLKIEILEKLFRRRISANLPPEPILRHFIYNKLHYLYFFGFRLLR